jgi:type IV pilus assembly protein PilE
MNKRGFTLAEMMMTIAIIGMLAAIAVPNFTKSMNSARYNEARVNLNIIHTAQKVYRLNRNTYWNGGANQTIAQVNTALGTDLTARFFTTYTVTGAATTYSVSTTALGKTFTINQTGTLTET